MKPNAINTAVGALKLVPMFLQKSPNSDQSRHPDWRFRRSRRAAGVIALRVSRASLCSLRRRSDRRWSDRLRDAC